jgi:membrane-associated phospholipid phosphatase
MWSAISNLGDAAMTLPLAVACCVWLAMSLSGWRAALAWLTPLCAGMLLVGFTKVLYAGCGLEIPATAFRVISGHTMLAAAVWPMAFLLVSRSAATGGRRVALILGFLLAALIGVARVFDQAHTTSEVVAGWAVGTVVTMIFVLRKDALALPSRLRPFAIVSMLLVSAAAYGHHAPIQAAIESYSPVLCQRLF